MKNISLISTTVLIFLVGFGINVLAQSKEWSIVTTYPISGKASGLAWDGQYLYYGIYGANGDRVYRFNPSTGQETLLFTNPNIGDSFGMTYDGEHLWIIDHPTGSTNPALAIRLDFSGNILQTIALPNHYMSGIAYDNGDFWVCTYYPDPGTVYKIDNTGSVLTSFIPPDDQPWDAALQDEFLWIVDYNAYNICKVDTATGQTVECHPCENQRPAGVVYDGQYLWYVDGPLSNPSTLYKVDLGGSGTPQINLPYTSWDYGNVAVGDSAVWSMNIGNTGTAPLEIENLQVPGAAPIFCWESFPVIIEPAQSVNIDVIFRPTAPGTLNTNFQVLSSDPINPSVNITVTGEAVLVGPSIEVPATGHNFGEVRVGAHTRWFMTVKNIGNEALIIQSIVSNEPAFYVEPGLIFPVSLNPLEEFNFGIWFNPEAGESYSGVLDLSSNDPNNPVVNIDLSGEGIDQLYVIGDVLWHYNISTSWDNSPKAIGAIQDITGDGVHDVIISSEDNYIRCFNGNSHGPADIIWEFEIYSGNVYQQQALTIHNDINGDGYQDVIVGTTGGDRSVTAICGKSGQQIWKFSTASMWGSGGWVYAVDASNDYNGDGIADVVATAGNDGSGTGPRRAFCLDGATGAYIWDYFFGGPGFSVMGISDVNGDGVPDVLAGGSNAGETEGRVVCLNGTNGNTIWTYFTAGSSVWGLVQLGDVSGDGIPDVAAGDFGGNYYGFDATNGDVLFSNAIGGFTIITKMIMLDDVNADGFPDILFGSSSSNVVVVSGYNGENIWLKPVAQLAWNVARINDVNGDGVNDVVVGTLYQNNYVYYLDGLTGDEIKSINFVEAVDAINTIPDITGDGSQEVVAGGREGKVVCYSGGVDTWTSAPQTTQRNNMLNVSVNPNPFNDLMTLSITSNPDRICEILIITAGGLPVKHFGDFHLTDAPANILWDGANMQGAAVKPGLYFVVITDGRYQKALKLIKE
jgi:hypothetical protein